MALKLVVGLGNPGGQYSGTRHNVGFDAIDVLARKFLGQWRSSKFEAQLAEILIDNHRVLLAAPQTFMNLSGRSVKALITFYRIPATDLIVVCDDMNLPTGKIRLRASGSAGGQKGLQNTIDQLGTNEFPRLRIGIDRPPEGHSATNYVLQRFGKSEREVIDAAVEQSVRAIETWVVHGTELAMNRFNAPVL
jgi:PTH1 family peptidyl-tRNA hydrolase